MTSTIVDSNVLIDLIEEDGAWREWSQRRVEQARRHGDLVINPVIFAEVAPAFRHMESLERALPVRLYSREDLPWEAAFLAGWAFVAYRRRGGMRRAPLPDFFIGAHAQVQGHDLLTRAPRRYRAYFPAVELIAPDTHP